MELSLAIEEAIVNAVYHKNYQIREPIEIRILPDKIEIINYGGPDRSVKIEDINKGIIRSRRYRNSRIGDFFKEIDLCEAKGTGIPTIKQQMKNNNSPEPIFETDDDRTFFIATLPMNELFHINEDVNGQKVGKKSVEKSVEKIIELIKINPHITQNELSKATSLSIRGIEKNISILKDKGIISRIGPDKGGHWQVNIK